MSDRIEPMTHIDIRVVRNLLVSRLNEGRDIIKLNTTPKEWKKTERSFQEKCKKAVELIDEAIAIKEGKSNEVSNIAAENPNQAPTEGNASFRETGAQSQRF